MLWSYIGTNASFQKKDSRIGYDAPEIWPWEGSPDLKTFDLTRFNNFYFDRLKRLAAYAESRGIAVLITVHDGWTKGRFSAHPFNHSLGNGPLLRNYQYVALYDYEKVMPDDFNPRWNWKQKNQYFQEKFCGKLIEELNPYSNVMYEIFNEGEWYDAQLRRKHEIHFLNFFRSRCNNILISNSDHIKKDKPHNNYNVDIISLHGKWINSFKDFQSGFNAKPPKPYLLTEPVRGWRGNDSLNIIRRSMWEVALAGAGWVNQNECSFGWDPNTLITRRKDIRDSAYDFAGYCSKFFNDSGINLADMEPDGNLSSTGICLAEPGYEYVIYVPEDKDNDSGKVDLKRTDFYDVVWYNPRTGELLKEGFFEGSWYKFRKPDELDWILFLKLKK
jgi:hypothetical protein